MFNNIKSKIQTVQQDITQSLKSLTFGESASKQYRPTGQRNCDFDAGFDILDYYQNVWKTIHEFTEGNAKKAENVDSSVSKLSDTVQKQENEVKQLNYEICMLPELTNSIQDLTTKIGEVESLIEDVHSSLINLENLVDEGKAQEIHVDEKFRLALYKERKHAEFETCKFHLKSRHQEKIREQAIKQSALLRERQDIFKEAFEEEMKNYVSSGHLERLPCTSKDPPLQLHDVILDEDPKALDDFLADTVLESPSCSNNEISSDEKES